MSVAATDARVLMEALQSRIDTLDKLIREESQRRWTTEAVLRADRALMTDALMLVASNTGKKP